MMVFLAAYSKVGQTSCLFEDVSRSNRREDGRFPNLRASIRVACTTEFSISFRLSEFLALCCFLRSDL
ncbi:unnamed protein product [Victoria cruziana]